MHAIENFHNIRLKEPLEEDIDLFDRYQGMAVFSSLASWRKPNDGD